MDINVTAETTIARPRALIAAIASDPANDTKWISGIKEVRSVAPQPFGVGTRVERAAEFRKKPVYYTLEVVGFEAGVVVDMKSVKAPFPMRVTYRFEDAPGGTRASIHIGGGPGGLMGLLAPLIRRTVRKSIAKDLENLRRLAETEA